MLKRWTDEQGDKKTVFKEAYPASGSTPNVETSRRRIGDSRLSGYEPIWSSRPDCATYTFGIASCAVGGRC